MLKDRAVQNNIQVPQQFTSSFKITRHERIINSFFFIFETVFLHLCLDKYLSVINSVISLRR